jgi:uncharacterized protein involved in cysteine biosynthesis
MKKIFILFFGIMIYTQIGCAFVITTTGSFLGNLSADLVMEKIEKNQKDNTKKSPGKKL